METVYWEDIFFPHWWNCVLGGHILPSLVETVYWENIFFHHWRKLYIGQTYSSLLDGNCVLGRHSYLIGGNCVLGRHILPSLVETA
jgi:hypothetical protein